jgi:hypothetical protein
MTKALQTKTPPPHLGELTTAEERVLLLLNDVHYLTRKILTLHGYSQGSYTYVGELLKKLSGGDKNSGYIVRITMPNAPGNSEHIYSLGRRGRDYLRGRGINAPWYYRGQRASPLSFSFILHHLGVAQFYAALHAMCCRVNPAYQVIEARTAFTMAGSPPLLTLVKDGQETHVAVIPDAWVFLERTEGDPLTTQGFPLWIEVDRGTESQAKFQQLLLHRLKLVITKGYEAYFDESYILLVYLAVGTAEYRARRLETMLTYTQELLTEQHLTAWSSLFRFAALEENVFDTQKLLTNPVWRVPFSNSPVCLFSSPEK